MAIMKFQIGKQLSFVYWCQLVDQFIFDNDTIFDNHIDTITSINPYTFIDDR